MKRKQKVHVVPNRKRYKATKWIIEDAQLNGEQHVISRTVTHFPCLFKGNTKENLGMAS